MATNQDQETRTKIDDINDSLTRAEQKLQNNKKLIMWICVITAAVVALILLYIFAIHQPGKNKANDEFGMAHNKEMAYLVAQANADSASQAKGAQEVAAAYEAVAASQGSDGGNNATLMAAIYNYKNGDYQKAIKLLDDYSAQDKVIGATSLGLKGDCYVNLDKYEEAIKCFQKAASVSDNNPALTPFFLMKEATVQHHLKNYDAEAKLYETIVKEYPDYQANVDFNAYLERAKALAAQKK